MWVLFFKLLGADSAERSELSLKVQITADPLAEPQAQLPLLIHLLSQSLAFLPRLENVTLEIRA